MEKTIKVESHGSLGAIVWLIGWLFTIGFLKLTFWKGALALIVWPYFLGTHFGDSPPSVDALPEPAGLQERADAR